MSATVINYLYEDLPEGHTVLASEWNTAMSQIKEAINLHAILIDQKISIPFEAVIGSADGDSWVYSDGDGLWHCTINQSRHNKGTRPQVEIWFQDGRYYRLASADASRTEAGDIQLSTNAPVVLHVFIR